MSDRIFAAALVVGMLSCVPVLGVLLVGASWLVVTGSVPWWYATGPTVMRFVLGFLVAALWLGVIGGLVKLWEVR